MVEAAADFPSLRFPKDRTVLYVFEIAARLNVTEQHVIDLIDEGRLRAVNVGGTGARGRRHYRIPVEAWEHFVRANLL